jgi:hypothetical protein
LQHKERQQADQQKVHSHDVFCSSCVGIVRLRMHALFKYLSKDPDVIFAVE